jgi:hypothetical protein
MFTVPALRMAGNAAAGSRRSAALDGIAFTGEIGPDGALRKTPGVVPPSTSTRPRCHRTEQSERH